MVLIPREGMRWVGIEVETDSGLPRASEIRPLSVKPGPAIARVWLLPASMAVKLLNEVIRTGIFQEKVFTEAFNFKLSLRLLRNPNMAANGRFPTAVGDFKYEITN